MDPYQPPAAHVADVPLPAPTGLSIGGVIRDVVIVLVFTFIGGLVIGIAIGSSGGPKNPSAMALALAVSNILMSTIGFTISGCLARGPRWRHLAIVALGVWAFSLVNVFITGMTFTTWLGAGIFIAVAMGLGGGLSYIFKRSRPA